MILQLEWRVGASGDVIVAVDDHGVLEAVHRADANMISAFLTDMNEISERANATCDGAVGVDLSGEVVMSRAVTGEVLEVDPELFWDGIHRLFRSRGVDYDNHLFTRSD